VETARQVDIDGLSSGTNYTFQVRAENSRGVGPSATATLTTRAGLPTPPDSGSVRSFTAAPNPFNPQTAVRFELPEAGPVSLVVYNLAGQPVRTLLDGSFLPAGSHVVHWDSRDEQGHLVASGVYLLRWTRQDQIIVRKITLLR